MKQKYEKMIDEWVKKHYGDLERGVLSDEVKYKVLWKIYRKKYKKARETAKVLSDVVYSWHIENDSEGNIPCSGCEHYVPMHPEGLNVIPASCKIGRNMAPCCVFYSVKVDEKKAQKEMKEEEKPVTKSCHTCEYSKMSTLSDYMGAATAILYCEKKKCKCDLLDSQVCEYFKEKKK